MTYSRVLLEVSSFSHWRFSQARKYDSTYLGMSLELSLESSSDLLRMTADTLEVFVKARVEGDHLYYWLLRQYRFNLFIMLCKYNTCIIQAWLAVFDACEQLTSCGPCERSHRDLLRLELSQDSLGSLNRGAPTWKIRSVCIDLPF